MLVKPVILALFLELRIFEVFAILISILPLKKILKNLYNVLPRQRAEIDCKISKTVVPS